MNIPAIPSTHTNHTSAINHPPRAMPDPIQQAAHQAIEQGVQIGARIGTKVSFYARLAVGIYCLTTLCNSIDEEDGEKVARTFVITLAAIAALPTVLREAGAFVGGIVGEGYHEIRHRIDNNELFYLNF